MRLAFVIHEIKRSEFRVLVRAKFLVVSMGFDVVSHGCNGWGVKLTTHLELTRKLRMSGALPLFPIHVFMEWAGKIFYQLLRKNVLKSLSLLGYRDYFCVPIVGLSFCLNDFRTIMNIIMVLIRTLRYNYYSINYCVYKLQ